MKRSLFCILAALMFTTTASRASDTINACTPNNALPANVLSPTLPSADQPIEGNPMNEWFWFGQLGSQYTYHTFLFQFIVPNFLCPPGLCTDPSGYTTLLWNSVGLTDKSAGVFYQDQVLVPGTYAQVPNGFSLAIPGGSTATGGGGWLDHVTSSVSGYSLNLFSTSLKNPLIEMDGGFAEYIDPANGAPAGSNYYYSRTRMATVGTITMPNGTQWPTAGQTWFDREWNPCCFAGIPVGWDWYGVQLNNGEEFMVYDIYVSGHRDQPMWRTVNFENAPNACGQGVYDQTQVTLGHSGSWTSPHTGNIYPTSFSLEIPERGLSITVSPTVQDQELTAIPSFFTPWYEGSASVTGTENGKPVSGVGQIELFGYVPGQGN
jgi:hypothetical protein